MEETAKCPYTGAKLADEGTYTRDWWPEQLNLKVLHQNSSLADPMDKKFNYAKKIFSSSPKIISQVVETEDINTNYSKYNSLVTFLPYHKKH